MIFILFSQNLKYLQPRAGKENTAIATLMECSRQRISQLKKKAENKLAHLKKAYRS